MNDKPLRLYMTMCEMFSDHLGATGAYPEKFVLSTLLHRQYLRDWVLMRRWSEGCRHRALSLIHI